MNTRTDTSICPDCGGETVPVHRIQAGGNHTRATCPRCDYDPLPICATLGCNALSTPQGLFCERCQEEMDAGELNVWRFPSAREWAEIALVVGALYLFVQAFLRAGGAW